MKLKLLLLMSLLFFVEIGFAQNTVTYSSLTNTINVNSGVEGTVDILVNCYGNSSTQVFLDALQSCGNNDGILSTSYTNGNILIPRQNTTIRYKFKKTVTIDTQIVYKFSTNGSCTQAESQMIKITVNYKAGSTTTPTNPTTNVIDAGDKLTIDESQEVVSIWGSSMPGYSYSWQIKKENGNWVTIPNEVFSTYNGLFYTGICTYRRGVTKSTITSYSNEITFTIIPSPIINNSINFNTSGSGIIGSNPSGGRINSYQYSWVLRGGLEDIVFPDATGQNLEFPSWLYSPANENLKATTGLYVIRFVKSGSQTLSSNLLKLEPTPTVQNNAITLNGSTISGSLPTGGNGTYEYSWLYTSEEIGTFEFPEVGQNLELPSWIYNPNLPINVYQGVTVIRVVKSGNRSVSSNTLKLVPFPATENNTITLNGSTISGSVPTGGNGIYEYSWVYTSEDIGTFEFPGEVGQNLQLPSWVYNSNLPINVYYGMTVTRIVKSRNRPASSNILKILPLSSNKIALNDAAIQSDLSVEELVTVYPNPTSGSINFSTNFSTDKQIEIILYSEKLGNEKSVYKGTVTPNQVINWNIPASYQKGIYFYKILSGNKEFRTGKIIVQ
ncbi:putative secreted protein (Por secretion system target) [Flavobacterium chryseum]|uniref:T9SS type A sorting domain-containing protein n=1 Tax=Flavobacterium sp. P3160 TaxID=2512113 RepID=UPI00105C76A0|nr:T9SS type A sorting domain-containing protein [Flavobacterium sp. P3160]TDO77525.1 putative secreted protein (Por secretion system target) [Flavobacterium sp. P3160]